MSVLKKQHRLWWLRTLLVSRLALCMAFVDDADMPSTCILDPTLPSNLTSHANSQLLCQGFLNVSAAPYNAAGDGVADDSDALQLALNDAYIHRMQVLLPAGRTFLVSKQLLAVQPNKPPTMREYGYQIVGDGTDSASRPVIRLKDKSIVENEILVYYMLFLNGTAAPPSQYSALFRGVDIDMGNNPNISALSMSGAQLCSIEDVTIKGNFYAGVVGLPGSGGYVSNLEVIGGKYGIWQQQFRPNPSVSGLVLTGQSECGILLESARGPLVISGFNISATTAKNAAICVAHPGGGADGSLAIEDGIIEAQLGINNTDAVDLSIKNVYFTTTIAVTTPSIQLSSVAGSSRRLVAWSYTHIGSKSYVHGKDICNGCQNLSFPKVDLTNQAPQEPPDDLVVRHSWSPDDLPTWKRDPLQVIDVVRDYGCTPDWVNNSDNDGIRIQQAINDANGRAVFIPRGAFDLFNTLVLQQNTNLIGAGKHVATLNRASHLWHGGLHDPLVVTNGTKIYVSDIVFQIQSDCKFPVGLDAVGPFAGIRHNGVLLKDLRTAVNRSTSECASYCPAPGDQPALQFSQQAGGKVFGISLDHIDPACPGWDSIITINETMNPLHFYQASVEHFHGSFQVQVWRSSNIHIHSFKYECEIQKFTKMKGGGLLSAHSTSDLSIFGGSGNYGIMNASMASSIFKLWGCSNTSIAAQVRKPQAGEFKWGEWIHDVSGINGPTSVVGDQTVSILEYTTIN